MNLTERDRKYIWHPFTPQKDMMDPVPIVRGKGTLLIDENGKEYIDAISSWWVNLHGHGHSYIAERIYEQALQLEQVIFAGFTHQPAVDLAEKLLQLLPRGFAKVFYSDNGSTSTEVALKMAIQYWWNTEEENKGYSRRTKILALENAYHGDTFGAMSVSERSVFTLAFHDRLFEVVFLPAPTNENIAELKQSVKIYADSAAAFIYEPLVQGAGGMKMYAANALNELLREMHAHEIICIADEVMTGFGRTGKIFASEWMEELPDIICLSKGLTGGTMALGATVCNKKIYDAYVTDDKRKTFFHGHSFTANPLACTAALASMELLEQQACINAINLICKENEAFKRFLEKQYNGICRNIRCCGTILAFEIALGKDEYLNSISTNILEKSLQRGVYLRPLGNTLYIMPPYCITAKELKKVYDVIKELLEDINVHAGAPSVEISNN